MGRDRESSGHRLCCDLQEGRIFLLDGRVIARFLSSHSISTLENLQPLFENRFDLDGEKANLFLDVVVKLFKERFPAIDLAIKMRI